MTADTFPTSLPELILKRIRLRAQIRIAWLREVWKQNNREAEETFTIHHEIDGYLIDHDTLEGEQDWLHRNEMMHDQISALELIDTRLETDKDSRLSFISKAFHLDRFEQDVFQTCLALAMDPNLGRIFAYLQDHEARSYVTEPMVARLFGHGRYTSLSGDTPLKLWRMINEQSLSAGEPSLLSCDPFVRNWVLGIDEADETLMEYGGFITPVEEPLRGWPVESTVDFIRKMTTASGKRVRIIVSGFEGSGRRTFADFVLRQVGLVAFEMEADRIPEDKWKRINLLAQRQAILNHYSPVWVGESMQNRYWSTDISSWLIQFIIVEPQVFVAADKNFVDLRVEMPVMDTAERSYRWQKHVPQVKDFPPIDFDDLVFRQQPTIGQIIAAGRKMISGIDDIYAHLRNEAARSLGRLAEQVNSSFTWDDLVLDDSTKESIEDFIFEATVRNSFWEKDLNRRLFPQGRSLVALFNGSPGTGKTMAAQVIANSLKMDLYRIDLSMVVSKYIGDSSKNIERILARATHLDIILFFDEADALFGKRIDIKDAHDRYANSDTNYLLQAIENYQGIVILASNKKSNIDSGFMRRFRYVLEFQKPTVHQRVDLWRRLVGELAGEQQMREIDPYLLRMAEAVELTGAQIKLATLSAVFIGMRENTRLNPAILLKATERELAKEGKGINKQLFNTLSQPL